MSFHGAIMSMEDAIVNMEEKSSLPRHIQKAIEIGRHTHIYEQAMGMADHISDFAKESDHDLQHMKTLGQWLTDERNNISGSEVDAWNIVIRNLINYVAFCRCDCLKNEMAAAVRDVVKEIAQDLQPGQDCSELLASRAQEAIATARLEWTKSANDNPYDFFRKK